MMSFDGLGLCLPHLDIITAFVMTASRCLGINNLKIINKQVKFLKIAMKKSLVKSLDSEWLSHQGSPRR